MIEEKEGEGRPRKFNIEEFVPSYLGMISGKVREQETEYFRRRVKGKHLETSSPRVVQECLIANQRILQGFLERPLDARLTRLEYRRYLDEQVCILAVMDERKIPLTTPVQGPTV